MEIQKQLRPAGAVGQTSSVQRTFASLLRDESAQDIIEYALIAVVVGLGTVVATRGLATDIGIAFSNVRTALTSGV